VGILPYPGVNRSGNSASLDHDEFGLAQSKIMSVTDSHIREWNADEKPTLTFSPSTLELQTISIS
jgi:hypothetical protein